MVMDAGAVKYGLEVVEGLVESGEFCRGLGERSLGRWLCLAKPPTVAGRILARRRALCPARPGAWVRRVG